MRIWWWLWLDWFWVNSGWTGPAMIAGVVLGWLVAEFRSERRMSKRFAAAVQHQRKPEA